MIEGEQSLFGKRVKKLNREERIASGLLVHQLRQRRGARRLAAQRIRYQMPEVFTGKRRKRDLLYPSAGALDGVELAPQRMGGINLVIPISPNQHQMLHVRLSQQILQQVQRCRVEPLQIVEEQRQWVLRPGEHGEKAPENQMKAALRVMGRQLRNRRLVADDELQLRNQVYYKPPVRA